MTPEEAGELLDFSANLERRTRRYMLEGGTRKAWKCVSGCGCMTEAHSVHEARAKLTSYTMHDRPEFSFCNHAKIEDTGRFVPPRDFS